MAGENAPLIEARDLKFSYRNNGEMILKGISFSIHSGEFVALTGPSGSGKSTLFYLLGCLLDRYQGDVIFKGQSIKAFSQNERSWLRNQEIGFVFQQFYLLPRASVLDNILLPTYFPFDDSMPEPKDIARAREIAEKLGITELLDRNPQELSGGQQQRVAIARALLRKAQLILADEPTGNLDSKSSDAVMELLRTLHREGHTVVIVTHSPEIASQCSRVLRIKDGELESDTTNVPTKRQNIIPTEDISVPDRRYRGIGFKSFLKALPIAWSNIKRSRAKSALTMLGVSLGVAAVLSTMSLGSFAKEKILEGYQSLGVNTLRFSGYGNWRGTSDYAPASFSEFKWESDIVPLLKVFPEITALSPYFWDNAPKISFGGKTFSEGTMSLGVGENYFAITGQSLVLGRSLSVFDVEGGSPVCVVGDDVRARLFGANEILNRMITIGQDSTSVMQCRIIGVLSKQPTSQEESQVNAQVFLPYTYFIKNMPNYYQREFHQFIVKISDGFDPAATGSKIQGFFKLRYGSSGYFEAASDAKLISQMNLFLNVFSGLLSAVAIIALIVGGVGINNMMLASLSERLKELGLRKALGATPRQLRYLMLGESMLLCSTAGLIGLVAGFCAYETLVFAATRLIPDLDFAWIFEPAAFLLSFVAILITGLCSGLTPAMKAEKLDVMEALRQDI